eukprot:6864007-Pyramimonas_sp.AAC.1
MEGANAKKALDSPEWNAMVHNMLKLYVNATNPIISVISSLPFHRKRHAITATAEAHVHKWVPLIGERLCSMHKTGRLLDQFMRPMEKTPHKTCGGKQHIHWNAVSLLIWDSTTTFFAVKVEEQLSKRCS